LIHNIEMTTLGSEAELIECFRESERDEVELSDEVRFPLELDAAVAWALGPRAFLLFQDRPGGRPRGIVLHRNNGAVPDVATMCEWCHAVRGHGRVKLLTIETGERRRIGLYLCSDLGCVSGAPEAPGPDDLPEGLAREERTRRIHRRICELASRRVF
jgi:hypothetical protein